MAHAPHAEDTLFFVFEEDFRFYEEVRRPTLKEVCSVSSGRPGRLNTVRDMVRSGGELLSLSPAPPPPPYTHADVAMVPVA